MQLLLGQLPSTEANVHLDAYMTELIEDDSDEDVYPKHKTSIITKEQPQECYICLVERTAFNETCGEPAHQVCQGCYQKMQVYKGCPMCRNDLVGFTGRKAMTTFFTDALLQSQQSIDAGLSIA